MFSSMLPGISPSMKFTQNGPSKQSNRFSVRVFKAPANAPFPYPMNPKFVDKGYRSMAPAEQPLPNWYNTNLNNAPYAPPPRANYNIYPNPATDMYIYEQSLASKSDLFSNSDLDNLSTFSAFSPAMSTDSTMALKSPVEPSESSRIPRSVTPAIRSNYTSPAQPALQAPAMTRTTTSRYMDNGRMSSSQELPVNPTSRSSTPFQPPPGAMAPIAPLIGFPFHLPEYDPSTISEMEVEERDRLAKMNANFNAVSSSSFSTTSPVSSQGTAVNGDDLRRTPAVGLPHKTSPSQADTFTRGASSQPRHPDLHFSSSRPGYEDSGHPPASMERTRSRLPAHSSRESSPPSVERVSSQLPPEDDLPHPNGHSAQLRSALSEARARDAQFNPDRIARTPTNRTSPQTTSIPPHSISQSANTSPSSRSGYATYGTGSQTAAQEQPHHPPREQREDRIYAAPVMAPELSRQRRPSMSNGNSSHPDPSSRTMHDSRDYVTPRGRDEYRPYDGAAPIGSKAPEQPSSTPRDYVPSYQTPADSHRDIQSANFLPLRGEPLQTADRDAVGRAALGSDLRREARTPAPQQLPMDRGHTLDDQHHMMSSSRNRRQSYIQPIPPDVPSRIPPREVRTSPESRSAEVFQQGPLTASPKDMRRGPDEFDSVPTPSYARGSAYDTDRPRERSTSFSKPTRPVLSTTSSSQAPPNSRQQNGGYHESRHASDYERDSDRERERDRRGSRSGSTSTRSPPSRSSEAAPSSSSHRDRPDRSYEGAGSGDDRRTDQRGGSYGAPSTYTQATPTSYAPPRDREREREREPVLQREPERRAATVQTASSTTSSRSNDLHASKKVYESSNILSHDPRTSYFDPIPPVPPQPTQPYAAPPAREPARRQSDGDQPYSASSTIPDSRYDIPLPPSSSSSKTSSNPSLAPISIPHPPEPHRRFSDGDQNTQARPPLTGRNSAPLMRSVRWNENLIAPSPILAPQRRKGFFNRRGDQLWTNEGAYKPPLPSQEYPPDLDEYPDCGEGWMNEEGVRIDLSHRLVPKQPLRSALKTVITKP